jgi:hypothetical protein
MVKGVLEHPELMRTIDSPVGKSVKCPFGNA